MPPQNFPGNQQQPQDPALRLAQLQLQAAQLSQQIGTDDGFEAVLSAQQAAQRATRENQKTVLAALEAQIAELQPAPAPAPSA